MDWMQIGGGSLSGGVYGGGVVLTGGKGSIRTLDSGPLHGSMATWQHWPMSGSGFIARTECRTHGLRTVDPATLKDCERRPSEIRQGNDTKYRSAVFLVYGLPRQHSTTKGAACLASLAGDGENDEEVSTE